MGVFSKSRLISVNKRTHKLYFQGFLSAYKEISSRLEILQVEASQNRNALACHLKECFIFVFGDGKKY